MTKNIKNKLLKEECDNQWFQAFRINCVMTVWGRNHLMHVPAVIYLFWKSDNPEQ